MNTLTDEIIEKLESIDNTVMDSEMAMYNTIMDIHHKEMKILEYCNTDDVSQYDIFQEEYISEGNVVKSVGNKLKQAFQKLWEIIKNIFSWMAAQVKRFINFVKNIFRKKKKNVNQIAAECGIKPNSGETNINESYVMEAASSIEVPGLGHITPQEAEFYFKFNDDDTFEIKFCELPSADILSDGMSVARIKYDNRPKHDTFFANTKGQHQSTRPNIALFFLDNPIKFNELCQIVENVNEAFLGGDLNNSKGLEKTFNLGYHQKEFFALFGHDDDNLKEQKSYIPPKGMKYSLKEFTEFQKKLNEISIKMKKINDLEKLPVQPNRFVINMLNMLVNKLGEIQFSMNSLTAGLRQIFTINKRYVGSIKNLIN
jgi:hypothetical protein